MLLSLCNLFAFVSYPCGTLLVAQEKIKDLYIVYGLQPLVYWIGVFLLMNLLNIHGFAIMKLTVFVLMGCFYLWYSLRFIEVKFDSFLKQVVLPSLPGFTVMAGMLFLANGLFCIDKSIKYLFLNAAVIGSAILIGFAITYFTSPVIKNQIKDVIKTLKK